ncbi:MAG: nuclear transport factor 2 family protein [Marinomonas sp.]
MRKVIIAAAAGFMAFGGALAIPVKADDTAAYASVIQGHVNAYRARDLDAFVATFAPDAVVVANGIPARGRASIRAFYAANFSPNAPTIRINASHMDGGRLYMEAAYIMADGSEMCCSQAHYTVENGLITRLDVTG